MRHIPGRLDWHTQFVDGMKFLLSPTISVRWRHYSSVYVNPEPDEEDETLYVAIGKTTNGFFEVMVDNRVLGIKEFGRMSYDELKSFCNYNNLPVPPVSYGLWNHFKSYREKLQYIC